MVWMFTSIILLLIVLFTTVVIYNKNNEHDIVLLQTQKQRTFIILLPASIVFYAIAWNVLRGMRPKKYESIIDIWNGFVWHFFQPRIKKGQELVNKMKDLVRGTIYSDLDKVIQAYQLFKNIPGI